MTAPDPVEAAEPRRRTRTRRERPAVEQDGQETVGFDAAILPPSVAPVAVPASASEESTSDAAQAEEKPRRRRVRAAPAEVSQAS
jgi:hypothetical protein